RFRRPLPSRRRSFSSLPASRRACATGPSNWARLGFSRSPMKPRTCWQRSTTLSNRPRPRSRIEFMNTTKTPPLRVLHLEDNDHDAELVRRTLADDGINIEVTRVMKQQTFVDALENGAFDLIMSDYSMPGFDGGSALALARKQCPDTPFVFVSGT